MEADVQEQITFLEKRLTFKSIIPRSTILDGMIDDIEAKIAEEKDAVIENTTVSCLRDSSLTFQELKKDTIHRSLTSGHRMIQGLRKLVLEETEKYSLLYESSEFAPEQLVAMIDAIEKRRSHMIEYARYKTQTKLATYFEPNQSTLDE